MPSREGRPSATVKAQWTSAGTLAYSLVEHAAGSAKETADRDSRLARLRAPKDTYNSALSLQLDTEASEFEAGDDGIPSATINADVLTFKQIHDSTTDDVVTSLKERRIWQLASMLFDDIEVSCASFMTGIPTSQIPKQEAAARRGAVLAFWQDLTREKAMGAVRKAKTSEAKALAFLSCGDTESACTTLIDGKNFFLATMVAQLPLDAKGQDLMKQQLETWRDQNSISEFSVEIRALYELIAGNAGTSEGKKGAPEDRAPAFSVSEALQLDWKQALGLRLWYGDRDLIKAVKLFIDHLESGRESISAAPEKTLDHIDIATDNCRDGLLTLLQLYSAKTSSKADIDIESIFSPITLTGNPLDARLGWQLATLLKAKGFLDSSVLPDTTLDGMTSAAALQLEAEMTTSSVLSSCSVLLHLCEPSARKSAVTGLLNRRAALLAGPSDPFTGDASSDTALQTITKNAIPAAWLHSARAQFAASRTDYTSQAAYLLLADDIPAAHKVLIEHVGPAAVISEDYDALREILGHFLADNGAGQSSRQSSSASQKPSAVQRLDGWKTGGQLYFDFVHLTDLLAQHKQQQQQQLGRRESSSLSGGSESAEEEIRLVLRKLLSALGGVKTTQQGPLEQRVAITEMSRVVREAGTKVQMEAEMGQEDRKRLARLRMLDDHGYVEQGGKMWELFGRALKVG